MYFTLWDGHNPMGTRKYNVVVWMRWSLSSLKHLNTLNTAEYFTLWEGPKTMEARVECWGLNETEPQEFQAFEYLLLIGVTVWRDLGDMVLLEEDIPGGRLWAVKDSHHSQFALFASFSEFKISATMLDANYQASQP